LTEDGHVREKGMWKPVVGYEGLYEVSDTGQVRSLPRNGTVSYSRILRPNNVRGYLQVALQKNGKRKDFKVHRLVADAFIPNPERKRTVNHIDGNKGNNRVENLEWATDSENQLHSVYVLGNGKASEVEQYSKDGIFIKAWKRITDASTVLGIDDTSIVHNCAGRRSSAGGFVWKYKRKEIL